jgi:hypothetical protein
MIAVISDYSGAAGSGAGAVNRSRSAAERVLMLLWAALTGEWGAFVFWIVLSYRASTATWTWLVRLIMLALAAAGTVAVLLFFRHSWRRAVARRLPSGPANSSVQQPGWKLALLFWGMLGFPELAETLWARSTQHHAQPAGWLLFWIVVPLTWSATIALMLRVLWRRQAENT